MNVHGILPCDVCAPSDVSCEHATNPAELPSDWDVGQLAEFLQLSKGHTFYPVLACKVLHANVEDTSRHHVLAGVASSVAMSPELLSKPLDDLCASGHTALVQEVAEAQLKLLCGQDLQTSAAAAYYVALASRCIIRCLPAKGFSNAVSGKAWLRQATQSVHLLEPGATMLAIASVAAEELRDASPGPDNVCSAISFLQRAAQLTTADGVLLDSLLAYTLDHNPAAWTRTEARGTGAPVDAVVSVVQCAAANGRFSTAVLSKAVARLLELGTQTAATAVLPLVELAASRGVLDAASSSKVVEDLLGQGTATTASVAAGVAELAASYGCLSAAMLCTAVERLLDQQQGLMAGRVLESAVSAASFGQVQCYKPRSC
jgi:hypothetical protein